MRSIIASGWFILLTCLADRAFAQSEIQGKAPSFAGKEIRLYTFKDYITRSKLLIESTVIGEDGKFRFNLPENATPTTFYGLFKIENFAAPLYIEPNSSYEILIDKPDSVDFHTDRVNYIETIIIDPKDELNGSIKKFNAGYDRFVKSNYTLFLQRAAKAEVDSFKTRMMKESGKKSNSYFSAYVKYSLASLDLIATANRQMVYNNYLVSVPVDYANDSYMLFFDEFYNKQFSSFSESGLRDMVLAAINEQKSYGQVMNALSKEKLLSDEKIRELVLMKELFENYNNKDFDKKSIHLVLRELVKTTNIPEHREIAMNILAETGKIGVGAKAPGFMLFDKNMKLVKLSDYKGKYVYLDFWATWCAPCIKEMPVMAELKKKYGRDVEFVSISVDKDYKTMQKFLSKKKDYDWVFVHYGNQPEVKELYNVQGIPVYYLVDPDGIIIQSPAYRPSGKIEETFMNISSGKKSKRKSYEWDW